MITKVLIANRGEIALRIVRACRDLGIKSVVAHSTVDSASSAVALADEAVCIGGPTSAESYLNVNNIIMAACLSGCDAIHPGIGFLSENAAFAEAVEAAGLFFIGPTSETIALVGDKVAARALATKAGLTVTPGSDDTLRSVEDAVRVAKKVGYPVLLKAATGGGGRGMRIANDSKELRTLFVLAQQEAAQFFADDRLLLERYIERPRHIEVQLLGDGAGKVIHLGERDCSVQKNHQKLFEESPAPHLTPSLRKEILKASTSLFRTLRYRGAGTVEFLIDGEQAYFMEVNARLQVEHPVSEVVSGIDLVAAQLLIAQSKGLPATQRQVGLSGYSLECRINGLSAGEITRFTMPGGAHVRVDTHLKAGDTLSPYYDSLLAKVIVNAPDRKRGLAVMERALSEVAIEGIDTNIAEQRALLTSVAFSSGRVDTRLYETVIGR